MIRIGVTGSRQWSPPDLPRVQTLCQRLVARLIEHYPQCSLRVGDAFGVDAFIVQAALQLEASLWIYGVNNRWRNTQDLVLTDRVELISTSATPGKAMYIARDKLLAESVDVMYAVWNGHSRGTMHTLRFARDAGALCFLWTPKQGWAKV